MGPKQKLLKLVFQCFQVSKYQMRVKQMLVQRHAHNVYVTIQVAVRAS